MLFIQNEKILSFSVSFYLWFWVQILFLLCHSLWSKVFQIFKGLNYGFEQYWTLFHKKKTRSLIQNVKLDFCWCMVRGPKDQRGPETDVRLFYVCYKKSCLSKSLFCHWLCLWSNCKRNPFSDFSTCGYLSIYLPVILGPNFSSVLTFVMAKL